MADIFGTKRKAPEKPKESKTILPKPLKLKKVIAEMGVSYPYFTSPREAFQEPEFDLLEIKRAVDTDSYIKTAFDTHVKTCLRQGYQFKSTNKEASSYIRNRLAHISVLSRRPFDSIIEAIFYNLVTYSNVFIYLIRDKKTSIGSSIKMKSGKMLEPIAGINTIDPTSMKIRRDTHGNITGYRQEVGGVYTGEYADFVPEDIIHIYYDKKDGYAFGTPYVVPVLDDVKLLRRLEQNIELLTVKHLFPLYKYTVGTEKAPAKPNEITEMEDKVSNLPSDGAIILPERHDISVVGAEGEALNVEQMLTYFENRVFTGLGVSGVSMGRGGTANRGTADTLDKNLQNRCKFFQRTTCNFLNQFLFIPLLLEGGFELNTAEDEDLVKMEFKDPDIDRQVKIENQAIQLWQNDIITYDEVRQAAGRDPLTEEERKETYTNQVKLPEAERMNELTTESEIATAKETAALQTTNNLVRPTNQHGTKSSSTSPTKDDLKDSTLKEKSWLLDDLRVTSAVDTLTYHWNLTKSDVVESVRDIMHSPTNVGNFNKNKIKMIIDVTKSMMVERVTPHMMYAYEKGLSDVYIKHTFTMNNTVAYSRMAVLKNKVSDYVLKLLTELSNAVVKRVRDSKENDNVLLLTMSVFDSLEYRIRFILTTEIMKAYNYGIASGLNAAGFDSGKVLVESSVCEICKEMAKNPISLRPIDFDSLPPFHPNCLDVLNIEEGRV